ncbi:NAD(P)/FAD-dependent oxidoreductase [Amorphus sp. 3PC139-8]|uniref:flavin-dependent monooxygenase QhpG n=1 Tax=Amorphus sp. 3PC139-8 TaxID=2735676 RepID=UPI00345DDF5B
MSGRIVDVAIAGGGPAGAFAALSLARAGAVVALVDPETTRPRLEGLSPRVADLLLRHHLASAFGATTDPLARKVSWGALPGRPNTERLVARDRFDSTLRIEAGYAGVRLLRGRLERLIRHDPYDGVELQLSSGDNVRARVMIDARGRRAPTRAKIRGPQTLAISALLADARDDAPRAEVIATRQGWLWAAHHPALGRWLQISVDADDLAGSGSCALTARMKRFLAQSGLEPIAGADLSALRPLARHAGIALKADRFKPPVMPIGDAAVALDPLSGHGLFWALSSALSALPLTAHLLDDPADQNGLAQRFFQDRVVATFWRQARIGRDFYRLATGFADVPFWRDRAAWPDDRPAHDTVNAARAERRVVVEANRLVERDVLITPLDPDGVAFVCGLPATELLARAQVASPHSVTPSELLPELPPERAKLALGWLRSRGLLDLPSRSIPGITGPDDGDQTNQETRDTA